LGLVDCLIRLSWRFGFQVISRSTEVFRFGIFAGGRNPNLAKFAGAAAIVQLRRPRQLLGIVVIALVFMLFVFVYSVISI
jgi:hypothetical protein